MAFDEALAARIRVALAARGVRAEERRMFGGLAFLVNGHMSIGVAGRDLMVRLGPERHEEALALPAARPMDFTGRPLRGFVFVDPAGSSTVAAVDRCLRASLEHVAALPPKRPAPKKRAKARRVRKPVAE